MNQLITLTEERREDFEEVFYKTHYLQRHTKGKTSSHHTATLLAITDALIEKMSGDRLEIQPHRKVGENIPEEVISRMVAHNSALTTQITHLTEYRDYLIKK